MRLRFRPSQRLRRRRDFQRVYASGQRARGRLVVVVAARNGLEWSRLGLSVGRAVWRSAVRRNRVRRIFREAFRLEAPNLPAGFDFVLIPARKGLWPGLAETRAELRDQCQRAARRFDRRQAGAGGPAARSRPEDPRSRSIPDPGR